MDNSTKKISDSNQTVETTLGLLKAVQAEGDLSQRGLAERLGVALGLTNALIKRCVRKGLLKVSQAPARRYAYYLTPKGFSEKSKLTAEYLSASLDFFRRARLEYGESLDYCANRKWQSVAFVGSSELTEIALLGLEESGLSLVAIVDSARNEETFQGYPVVRSLDELKSVDAFVITDSRDPQGVFDHLVENIPARRIMTPSLLHVIREAGSTDEEAAE